MTKDYEKEAVEAIAERVDRILKDAGLPRAASEAGVYATFIITETLAADPLRQKLGPAAVQALLERRAAIVDADAFEQLRCMAGDCRSLIEGGLREDALCSIDAIREVLGRVHLDNPKEQKP